MGSLHPKLLQKMPTIILHWKHPNGMCSNTQCILKFFWKIGEFSWYQRLEAISVELLDEAIAV